MQLKSARFGKYFGCTNAACGNTRKLLKNGEAAPPKMDAIAMPELKCQKVDDSYVLRDGATGLFLAASQFPKKRETRAPLVKELLPYRGILPQKYHYLLDAPTHDSEGNATVIRYSRKTKEQYVNGEKDGKATGFAVFNHGRKREWRLPLASAADFDMLQREFEHQTNQNKSVIYWDVVNQVRELAERRTKEVVACGVSPGSMG